MSCKRVQALRTKERVKWSGRVPIWRKRRKRKMASCGALDSEKNLREEFQGMISGMCER
ncbi:putative 5 exonuclease Apollo [Sesbania bispinosa]|nr:putative 5 exonuclease Apollo [Sesbania bispinosa]